MALRDEIRSWVLIQGKSQRAAAQHFGPSRNTVAKLLLEEPAPQERRYQRQAGQKTPVRDAALPHIEKWLQENEWLSRWAPKQCWTAHRMWVELRKLGIAIGESTVRMQGYDKDSPENGRLVPEMQQMLGSIRFLLEGHVRAESFEMAEGASLDGITVSLFKGGAAKLLRGFFLLKERRDTE